MNDDPNNNVLDRLEQATSAAPQARIDPKNAAWREGWLTWGKLLESADAMTPDMLNRLLDIPNAPVVVPRKKKRIWPVAAVCVALAASLLLAIGIVRYWPGAALPGNKNIGEPGNSIAQQTPRIPDATVKPNNTAAPSSEEDSLAWDDALDSRMTNIEEQMMLARYESPSLGSSFDSVRSHLESLSQEIEKDPL